MIEADQLEKFLSYQWQIISRPLKRLLAKNLGCSLGSLGSYDVWFFGKEIGSLILDIYLPTNTPPSVPHSATLSLG